MCKKDFYANYHHKKVCYDGPYNEPDLAYGWRWEYLPIDMKIYLSLAFMIASPIYLVLAILYFSIFIISFPIFCYLIVTNKKPLNLQTVFYSVRLLLKSVCSFCD